MITQQAQIIDYIDDYKLLMIATLVVIPPVKPWSPCRSGDQKTRAVPGRTGDRSRDAGEAGISHNPPKACS
jgi:hypothetical protein